MTTGYFRYSTSASLELCVHNNILLIELRAKGYLKMVKKLLFGMLGLIAVNSYAEPVKTLVEFYSFTCKHCANVNARLEQYIASHKIRYMDVNVDNSDAALPSNIMYYIAIDAGVGTQFKASYFTAVASGMPAYTPGTLNYVINQVKTPRLTQLIDSSTEQEHVKQKLIYANSLLATYHVQATPTFLINQTTLLEGEDVVMNFN